MKLDKKTQELLQGYLDKVVKGSYDESIAAQRAITAALTLPLQQGILDGDILSGIFEKYDFTGDQQPIFPLDFYRSDNADEYIAYVVPDIGRIPQCLISGDRVTIPTYDVGHGIDVRLSYLRDAGWNLLPRMVEVLRGGVTKKLNDDGFHVLLQAAVDRGLLVNDSTASAGQFTPTLVNLMKITMRRNAGGNTGSDKRGMLTHLFISPEAVADMRSWDVDVVDEITRREIFVATDGSYNKIFGVTLVDLDELGVGQEYQDYTDNTLGATLAASDQEFVLGLDLSNRDSFVHASKQEFAIFEDPTQHRANLMSMYTRGNVGFGVLNNARVLLGSM